jgi:hypothetical protein
MEKLCEDNTLATNTVSGKAFQRKESTVRMGLASQEGGEHEGEEEPDPVATVVLGEYNPAVANTRRAREEREIPKGTTTTTLGETEAFLRNAFAPGMATRLF